MEESQGLAASFQQPPPQMASQGQPFSSLSTASYFGGNAFGEDDPFQFAKPPASMHYGNNSQVADVNSQVGNFVLSQQEPPKQGPVLVPTFSPVQDKQFFSNAMGSTTNMLPPPSTVDLKFNEEINPPKVSSDNDISVANTASSGGDLAEQYSSTNVAPDEDDKPPSGGSSLPLTSDKDQPASVSGNPQVYFHSYSNSNPNSQPQSSVYQPDMSSGPTSLPAFSTTQQQYTVDGGNVSSITGTFTNADLPLSSVLQSGPMPRPSVLSSVQDGKELPHSTLLTNADISAGHGFGGMPSHSSSAANLSSLSSTPVDGRTNADFCELDQQLPGAPPTNYVNNLGPPTNAGYQNIPEQQQLQLGMPSTTGLAPEQTVTMTTAMFQPPEAGLVLQTNTEFDQKALTLINPPSSTVPPSLLAVTSQEGINKSSSDIVSVVPAQVTNIPTSVTVSSQTSSNFEVLSTTASTVSVTDSMPSMKPSTSKDQDVHNVHEEMKARVTDNGQHGDVIEQQFLTSPVAQSPTSAFVEYSAASSEKPDHQLNMSSGTQSVSSLLDCPDTSILASPYKIVLPSPKTVEEKQSFVPPHTSTTMQKSVTVSSDQQVTAVSTSAPVLMTATPKTYPAVSTLPVTLATMTSTPKQKDTHDSLPSSAAPLVQQQEPQQKYTVSGEQHRREYEDARPLLPPARQQEQEQSYHHHRHYHPDHQYDYDYRHGRGGGSGHYMEDDRGYYPPSRPHSRIPYDYYHPHDDYYYYRGRPEHYRDYVDDSYYYEDSRYYQERDSYYGREKDPYYGRERDPYYGREQPRYHDSRHPITYSDYPEYSRSRDFYDDRRMREPDSYRYYQQHPDRHAQYYYGEEGRYPEQKENIDRTSQSHVHTQPLETTVAPPEASTIYGPRDHFETSQVYNEETSHAQPSYVDAEYPGQYPERYPDQYPDHYSEQYHSQYYGGQQQYEDQVDNAYTNEEGYYEEQKQVQQEYPVERELIIILYVSGFAKSSLDFTQFAVCLIYLS